VADDLGQGGRADDLHAAHPGRLGARGAGAEQAPLLRGRGHGGGQGADHRDQGAAQGQLAQRHGARHLLGREEADGGKERQRDGEVEVRPLLGQVGGRQVHRDALGGERDRHLAEGGAHPFARLGHGLVGQAHDGEGRHPGRDGALHLHEPGLHALECHRIGQRDHDTFPWFLALTLPANR
jgi:hypothetical protein